MDGQDDRGMGERWLERPSEFARAGWRSRGIGFVRRAWLSTWSDEAVARAIQRPRVQVVVMHHVFEDERREFEAFLDNVQGSHECLSVSEAFDRQGRGGAITKPILCLTFDDGFAHHTSVGSLLRDRGVRATFFPCVEGLDDPAGSRTSLCQEGFGVVPIELMGWREAELLHGMGHEIGCHTRSHRVLGLLAAEALEDEIVMTCERLGARVGPIRSFAWPFGRWVHVSEAVAEMVTRAGIRWVVSALAGCHGASPDWARRECVRRTCMEPMDGAVRMMRILAASAGREGPLRWNPGARVRDFSGHKERVGRRY